MKRILKIYVLAMTLLAVVAPAVQTIQAYSGYLIGFNGTDISGGLFTNSTFKTSDGTFYVYAAVSNHYRKSASTEHAPLAIEVFYKSGWGYASTLDVYYTSAADGRYREYVFFSMNKDYTYKLKFWSWNYNFYNITGSVYENR